MAPLGAKVSTMKQSHESNQFIASVVISLSVLAIVAFGAAPGGRPAPPTGAPPAPEAPTAPEAPAFGVQPAATAGRWSAVATQLEGSTCDGGKVGDKSVEAWQITAGAGQDVKVAVAGATRFPVLNGTVVGGILTLIGASPTQIYNNGVQADSWFRLEMVDGKLKGVRRFLGLRSKGRGDGVVVPCFTDMRFTATRVEE